MPTRELFIGPDQYIYIQPEKPTAPIVDRNETNMIQLLDLSRDASAYVQALSLKELESRWKNFDYSQIKILKEKRK